MIDNGRGLRGNQHPARRTRGGANTALLTVVEALRGLAVLALGLPTDFLVVVVPVAFLVVDLGFSAFSVFSVLSDFSAFSLFLAVVFLVVVLAEAFCHGVSHVGQLGGCDGHSP